MHTSETQLNLFGNGNTYFVNKTALKFCIKKHDAKTYKLHYDIRLQFDDFWLKSFAVKPGPSMNPEMISEAVLVEDHQMSAFRREGTILDGKGKGSVLHFDEGYFTIPGVQSSREIKKELEFGIDKGSFNVLFCGYKIKGHFKFLRRLTKTNSDWIIQKTNDEWVTQSDILLQDQSILGNKTLEHYNELYNAQCGILAKLKPSEQLNFIKYNNRESFTYSRLVLPPRPNKILPYD